MIHTFNESDNSYSKGTGAKCSEKKIQKCIKNAKNMQESIIRSQGKNLIWMIHTFNESDNSHSKGTGAKYSEKKIQKCIKNVKNM